MVSSNFDPSTLSYEELIKWAQATQGKVGPLEETNKKLEEEVKQLRIKRISSLNNGLELSLVGDAELARRIRDRIPTHTYDSVSVTTIRNYRILGHIKDVRKIELKRETTFRIVIDSPWAFFSALFKSDSIYVQTLNETGIKQYLLNSSELEGSEELVESIKDDIQAAYTQYKTICIFVPDDCSEEALVKINSGSKSVNLSIRTAKKIRNFFS